jgi:2-C-methyl-D-erythritol 4-phosphate cytidylyltransferase / 2-C-methyl-D-erythritol 2,4-cyclodiphosphate synthase
LEIAALIVAAGRGSRAGEATGNPKQYVELAGRSMLAHSIAAFAEHPRVTGVTVVIHPDDRELYAATARLFGSKLTPAIMGGTTRQESVFKGLVGLAERNIDAVLIHDAARPFVTAGIIDGVISSLADHDGGIAAVPVADTLKRAGPGAVIEATLLRAGLWRAQTPQGFHLSSILDAHRKAASAGLSEFTDDAAIAEWAGLRVALTLGSNSNEKITTAEDLAMAQRRLAEPDQTMETRTGTGFDVHRFADGSMLWLCGVEISHERGLEGHSDADVGLHALTDALLGAIADGDIGTHFPPSDPQWKGASSRLFLTDAARRVENLGGRILNVDVTLLCEAPRIGPHRPAMRQSIAEILQIEVKRVSVKATTTEGLGFTGRREGIAAMASATVIVPAVSR